jgi:hypothetical protein
VGLIRFVSHHKAVIGSGDACGIELQLMWAKTDACRPRLQGLPLSVYVRILLITEQNGRMGLRSVRCTRCDSVLFEQAQAFVR